MPPTLTKRALLHAGLAFGAAALLPTARACEFFTTGLRITHPWTRASAPGATVAIVCVKFDQVTQADRLIGIETPLATGADIAGPEPKPHVDLWIPEGRETLLTEIGTTLRLVGLTQPLQIARAYPITLLFERGGAVQADLSVDYEPLG